MRKQAYSSWQTKMYESLVRACVVRYVHQYQGSQAAGARIKEQDQRGFAWVGPLSQLLAAYEAERTQYADLDAFVPNIAAFFNQYAESLDRAGTSHLDNRPQIVSMTPANGMDHVDPRLARITVVFDRPMQDGGWSLVKSGLNFPKIVGQPSYDKKHTTWTVPIQLQPNTEYHFMLNSARFQSFRSQEGIALEPVPISFKTRG